MAAATMTAGSQTKGKYAIQVFTALPAPKSRSIGVETNPMLITIDTSTSPMTFHRNVKKAKLSVSYVR
ncbi:MAG: hypothetical protein ACJ79V_24035 [Myxococcales bacterium]